MYFLHHHDQRLLLHHCCNIITCSWHHLSIEFFNDTPPPTLSSWGTSSYRQHFFFHCFVGFDRPRLRTIQIKSDDILFCYYDIAYLRVYSAAFARAWVSLFFHISATPLSRGSSGLGAESNAWMLNSTVRI